MLSTKKTKYRIITIVGLPCSGKSTICSLLSQNSVTQSKIPCYTSRKKRESDKHQSEYCFIEKEEFDKHIEEFFDITEIHKDYYGTKTQDIIQAISNEKLSSIICNIDVSLKLFYKYSDLIKLTYIDCSIPIIIERAKKRDQEGERTIERVNSCLNWSERIDSLITKENIPFVRIDNSGDINQTLNQIKFTLNN